MYRASLKADSQASATEVDLARCFSAYLSWRPRHTTGILSSTLWPPCSPHFIAMWGNERYELSRSELLVALSVYCEMGSWWCVYVVNEWMFSATPPFCHMIWLYRSVDQILPTLVNTTDDRREHFYFNHSHFIKRFPFVLANDTKTKSILSHYAQSYHAVNACAVCEWGMECRL